MLYSITLDFALPNNTPATRENVESEIHRFLQELETNPPQVTWEHLPQTSPQGWPEVRFVGSLEDITNVIRQWNGGDADAIDEMLDFIEPVLDYAIVEGDEYQYILLPFDWTCEMSEDLHPANYEALDWPTWSSGGPYVCKSCVLESLKSGRERIVRNLTKSQFDDYCNGKEI